MNDKHDSKFESQNPKFVISNLAWFVFAAILAAVVIQRVAPLGLAIAIAGGIGLGVLITREANP